MVVDYVTARVRVALGELSANEGKRKTPCQAEDVLNAIPTYVSEALRDVGIVGIIKKMCCNPY